MRISELDILGGVTLPSGQIQDNDTGASGRHAGFLIEPRAWFRAPVKRTRWRAEYTSTGSSPADPDVTARATWTALYEHARKTGPKAIIDAGTGNGFGGRLRGLDPKKIRAQRREGHPLARVSMASCRNSEQPDDKYDWVVANDLNPQKAKTSRGSLNRTSDTKELSGIFWTYWHLTPPLPLGGREPKPPHAHRTRFPRRQAHPRRRCYWASRPAPARSRTSRSSAIWSRRMPELIRARRPSSGGRRHGHADPSA